MGTVGRTRLGQPQRPVRWRREIRDPERRTLALNPKMTVNPLLDFSGLPRYGLIRAEHVGPAIDQLLAENRDLISRLTVEGTAASWDEFAEPLENANARLGRAFHRQPGDRSVEH